jgi:PAS domain S-box-containing protein
MAQDDNVLLNLKISRSFKGRIAKKAKDGGYGTVSNYIRSLLRESLDGKAESSEARRLEAIGSRYNDSGLGIVIRKENEPNAIMVNKAYALMHGYSVSEMIGKPISVVHAQKETFPIHAKMNIEKGPHAFITQHVRKDGSLFTALTETKAILDDKGSIVYRMALVQEIDSPE